MSTLKLAIIKKGSNWDLYVSDDNYFSSIAKVEGAKDSHFGNKHHIAKLMNDGYFDIDSREFTEAGLEALSGIHSFILFNDDGSVRSHWVKF